MTTVASWLGPPVIKRDFGTNGGSWTRQPAIIVIHSTEGTSTTDYQDGANAPHFTLDPEDGTIWQHISLGHAARALKNPSGGVETNRGGAIQIELIGTCDPKHRGDKGWNYLPDMDNATAQRIRKLLDMIHDAIPAIPLTTSVAFEPYPDPGYGSGHPRVSSSTWKSYKGVLGHQHVPENDHGDPGDIPIATILGDPAPPPRGQAYMFAIQQKGQSAKWISDGQTRRWVPDSAAWDKLVAAHCISNSPLLTDSAQQLTDCGGPVTIGTELPPGYTPQDAGWVSWETPEDAQLDVPLGDGGPEQLTE